jgi:hypothetical protein
VKSPPLSREALALLAELHGLEGSGAPSPKSDAVKLQAALITSRLERLMESTQGTP